MEIKVYFYGIRLLGKTLDLSEPKTMDMSIRQSIELFQTTGSNLLHKLNVYHELTVMLLKRLYFRKLLWETGVGTGKADSTGFATGGIWTCKGLLAGYLTDKSNFKERPHIQVIPYFNRAYFQSEMECIVSIRIGQAMYALLKVVRKIPVKKEAVI
ncbi:DUF2953 domain-containing protein [Virgibacillus siamensis]|uniref:DUF2953 domain-containing protein n=1 Tax=Virgibacillus siamensis TaxID=480071 RepID=UPI0015898D96|nr:DUF2953 domain-containing protein [Virgibacillus siamensis]